MTSYTMTEQMRGKIERWEGKYLTAYRDSVGVLTIGYGHTGSDVHEGQTITEAEADALLAKDIHSFENQVNNTLGRVATTQNQFDALVSFAFNLGFGALNGSTLMRLHKMGNYDGAAAEFAKWDHAGGQVLRGLLRRRQGEAAVYKDADYSVGE